MTHLPHLPRHHFHRRLSVGLAIAVTGFLGAAIGVTALRSSDEPAGAATVVRYDFTAGLPAGVTIRPVAGGTVSFVNGPAWFGKTAAYPAPCTAAPCPRALLELTDAPEFQPGEESFRVGADAGLTDAEIPGGHNLMQKGLFAEAMQWKLQIDDGRPSCRIKGNAGAVIASAPIVLNPADGSRTWWKIECERVGDQVTLTVDRRGPEGVVTRTWTVVRTGPIGSVAGAVGPPTIGGKGAYQNNDQFFGRVDNPHFDLGTW